MASHGGKRKGSGRKPKADEVSMIEKMDATLAPIKAWEELAKRVKSGDTTAIKTWLAYRYGQPKQSVDLSSSDGTMSPRTLDDWYNEQR